MTEFEWAVVGAGPAGILSVGKLIDAGVDSKKIAWIDPAFSVGDLGQSWQNVSSNTRVSLFLDFLNGCHAFQYKTASTDYDINQFDAHATCDLHYIVEPLQWVSDHLSASVNVYRKTADHIELKDRVWHIELDAKKIRAKNVILAVGSTPKVLPFSGPELISIKDALDLERLSQQCDVNDTVAVFGSSHSAILILKNLLACHVKRILNFYLSPLRYALPMDDWILFDNTGLKGKAAEWARDYIDGQLPKNLERFISSEEHLTQLLPECNKVIYALGFERRALPIIAGLESVQYNAKTGIIAPGLFGVGIAFPECQTNVFGMDEYAVGLWKFMRYVDRVLPIWMRYGA